MRAKIAFYIFLSSVVGLSQNRLINGTVVTSGYDEVVRILAADGGGCTATLVSKNALITAAHCAANNMKVTFTFKGTKYSAIIKRHPKYTNKGFDLAAGKISPEINTTFVPASVGKTVAKGTEITVLGYGCTVPGKNPPPGDGNLRIGKNIVVNLSGSDMMSTDPPNGSALCYGDSGGPAFLLEDNKHWLVGVNSAGNIKDTNWNTRLDLESTRSFLSDFASTNSVSICGLTGECSTSNPPPDPPPTCTLTANPNLVNLGQPVSIEFSAQGKSTSATLTQGTGGTEPISVPTFKKSIPTSSIGTFSLKAKVTGPGGATECAASYTVQQQNLPAPTCTLTAVPPVISLGESLILELQATGDATAAQIDGTAVEVPLGKRKVTPSASQLGVQQVIGSVSGSGGSNTCRTQYEVKENDPNPPLPSNELGNVAINFNYCGDNTISNKVQKVCIGQLSKTSVKADLNLSDVIVVFYTNFKFEILPVLAQRPRTNSFGDKIVEQWTYYLNQSINSGSYQVLDTKTAIVTRGENPEAIEGWSTQGVYFKVDQLGPPPTRFQRMARK